MKAVLGAGAVLATLLTAVTTLSGGASAAQHTAADAPPECTIVGDFGPDNLVGTDGDDVICGLGGDDHFYSSPGDDVYIGGDGLDWISFATLDSGVTVDLMAGTATGQGDDTLIGIENVQGSARHDVIRGDDNTYVMENGAEIGNMLAGYDRGDLIVGRGGGDFISGGRGNDTLVPGPGDDYVQGESDNDTVSFKFATGPVIVDLNSGTATGEGTDTILVENVIGTRYADVLTGSTAHYGTNGVNVLSGQAGDDVLKGLGNHDRLLGQAGNDDLDGGAGNDSCNGGAGSDTGANCESLVSIP